MKNADFKNLFNGVRETGTILRGMKTNDATDRQLRSRANANRLKIQIGMITVENFQANLWRAPFRYRGAPPCSSE